MSTNGKIFSEDSGVANELIIGDIQKYWEKLS